MKIKRVKANFITEKIIFTLLFIIGIVIISLYFNTEYFTNDTKKILLLVAGGFLPLIAGTMFWLIITIYYIKYKKMIKKIQKSIRKEKNAKTI